MAEFFVLKTYRGRGVGQVALEAALVRHPGDWYIGVPKQNKPAQAFWEKALTPYEPNTRDVVFDGDVWALHSFKGWPVPCGR